MTREMLDDLLVDVPRHVVPDVDAAWRTGNRRRRRGYAAGAAAVAVLALVLGVGVLGFDRAPSVEPADGSGVSGYPYQIPRPITLTDLPDRPGPMAGVMQLDGIAEWVVVDAAGRSWRLPDVSSWEGAVPALSDDGRMLGYLRDVAYRRSEFVLIDLVTGERTEVSEVGNGGLHDDVPLTDQPYSASGQTPGFWSPDNRWVAVHGGRMDSTEGGALLLSSDGEVRHLASNGWPLGWLPGNRLVLVRGGGLVVVVDTDGQVVHRVQLRFPEGMTLFGQWSGRLSPDGSTLALMLQDEDGIERVLTTYYVRDGRRTQLVPSRNGADNPCLPGWQEDAILAWGPVGLTDLYDVPVVIHPSSRWGGPPCGMFTSEALAGPVVDGPGLMEWRYWDWLWWWKQVLVALVVGALVLVGYVRRRRLD